MQRLFTPQMLFAYVLIAVGVIAFGWHPMDAAAAAGALPMLLGDTAVPAKFNRIREKITAFQNVVATGTASCEIPRYGQSLLSITLPMGGTTFTKSLITAIRLKLGAKQLCKWTGTNLDKMNQYKFGLLDANANFINLDFTQPNDKEMGGEMIGGIDMTQLPAGKLTLEVDIAGATAPTLDAYATWGAPQGNPFVQKVIEFTATTGSATGDFYPVLNFKGAAVQRLYVIYTGTDWSGTATSAALGTNTGNGAMGAITVSAACKVGAHTLTIIEPGANVGTFMHVDPDGNVVGHGVVASAYSSGGLAFTLADGGTDFIAGDQFTITVAERDGNLNEMEIKKDGRTVWRATCKLARYWQKRYGRTPQSKMYVADFMLDNHSDGLLKTDDAASLEFRMNFTAADTMTIYAEVLDQPDNL